MELIFHVIQLDPTLKEEGVASLEHESICPLVSEKEKSQTINFETLL